MNPKRKRRLYLIVFILIAAGGTMTTLMVALEQNINMFYPPEEVVSGVAPTGKTIRAGGMVLEESVQRGDGLDIEFVLTDRQGAEFSVFYTGILPDLFREGQGILVQGQLDGQGRFQAREVLAKHDEDYMPPELMDLSKTEKTTTLTGEL